jgi:two-component system chemotaxis sensor kinase CheA
MKLDPSRYAELFRTESREQLAAINRALLLLETGGDTTEPVSVVFRAVHTVKGMSATMGYHAVAEFAHELESVLDRVRRGDQLLAPDLMDALFASADALEGAIDVASEQAAQSPAMIAALQRLRDVAGGSATSEFPAMQIIDGSVFTETEVPSRAGHEARSTEEFPIVTGEFETTAPRPGRATMATGIPTAARATRHVRIDLARLDALMNLIGELVITRGRLLQLTATNPDPALDESMQMAARLVSDLQTEIMTMRMVPVWQVFDRFPRLVRDAARQQEKEVNFVVEGKEIELDRSLLDEIGEPIVHLLRNSIGHGIEAPAVRIASGKPRAGRLTLSAMRDRAAVLIRVSDDGRGIDRGRVLARARTLGLVDDSVREVDDDGLFRLIATPGFSTADEVSDLSGRGVGIDAVQAKARALGGSVELKTISGEGTTITIRLPVTLAIVRALLARSGTERYALPLTHVRETLEYADDVVQHVKGKPVLVLRDEVLPLLDLRDVVRQGALAGAGALHREIVVIERGEKRSGLVVDELIGQQDIVVKQFDAARDGLALFSGATILSDGAPALIMDVGSLFEGS